MTLLIQIAPGVLFSSDVLSPEWGRERCRNERGGDAIASSPVAEQPQMAAPEHDREPSTASGNQLSLL
ncbi:MULTISPECIES: hypothetical protein [Burkholderia]|uniref:hypothetical protein n=1 Tax=Burkholderia TaxID=32008 RepID=UPI000B7AEB21|nr:MULTISPECIES: hypothetical protein [Burkholderia]MBR7944641.1 hypothetical protein [Burkholderia cenocepacia]CAG2383169.1 hypothetical protein BCCR12632_07218 [Burkholderia cenocepacia]CAG2383173.1 hypothetical protein BCCR75389_07175 [Burkholderia cenocepacia]CAG2383186.1 hypothetical protein BCCR75388_07183 [Burkholderia cenocepacia]CAG2383214.1 hypothetical protein BCCR75384_07209 [Burkholderia cenocepacia]